jgi:hypothetical protein
MVSSNHLKPKEAGQIKATVNTAGRRGSVKKRIRVVSNDAKNPKTTLALGMDVIM